MSPELEAIREVNLRIGADLLIPDVLVAPSGLLSGSGQYVDAGEVALVAEIHGPGNTAFDRAWKSQRDAEGGIPFSMEVEISGDPRVTVYELRGRGYAEVAGAHAGETLKLTEPFELRFDPADLVGPRRGRPVPSSVPPMRRIAPLIGRT